MDKTVNIGELWSRTKRSKTQYNIGAAKEIILLIYPQLMLRTLESSVPDNLSTLDKFDTKEITNPDLTKYIFFHILGNTVKSLFKAPSPVLSRLGYKPIHLPTNILFRI